MRSGFPARAGRGRWGPRLASFVAALTASLVGEATRWLPRSSQGQQLHLTGHENHVDGCPLMSSRVRTSSKPPWGTIPAGTLDSRCPQRPGMECSIGSGIRLPGPRNHSSPTCARPRTSSAGCSSGSTAVPVAAHCPLDRNASTPAARSSACSAPPRGARPARAGPRARGARAAGAGADRPTETRGPRTRAPARRVPTVRATG